MIVHSIESKNMGVEESSEIFKGATVIRDNLQEILPLSKKKLIKLVSNLNPSETQKILEKLMILIKSSSTLGGYHSYYCLTHKS